MPKPYMKSYLLVLWLVFLSFVSVYARDVEIAVEDTDLELPLEGALLRSWDGKEYTCDEDGKVIISVPDDRQVVVQVAYPGYEIGRLVIPAQGDRFSIGLHLSGIMENQELVLEAARPGSNETKSGRSVAISDKNLARTAEIGILEDVITSIKLLPGVGYTGMFNARPSIRGGEPGDLTAVFDGFYVENPYQWGGGVSIFDPRMVQSAQLSHGVFSSRYGHTISGLLEITAKKPSPTDVEFELGVSSLATNFNVSYPLWGKGGVMLMGKVTYMDPIVWLYQLIGFEEVDAIKTAPYIRNGALSANYRFTADLELTAHGFIGTDGVEVEYKNDNVSDLGIDSVINRTDMAFNWANMLGFFITGLTFNPVPTMVLKTTAGAGFHTADLLGKIYYNLKVPYSNDFIDEYGTKYPWLQYGDVYSFDQTVRMSMTNTIANYQGRVDFDWDLSKGFLFALGVQELYSQWIQETSMDGISETKSPPPFNVVAPYVNMPIQYAIDVENQAFTSSAYTLLEYTTPSKRFGAELGLRTDHVYFIGRDFTIQTVPVLNPRLNLDFGLLKNKGMLDSLTLTVGTGLFSSMTDNISSIQSSNGIGDYEMKQNRSWTSIVGTKFDFLGIYSFNIEGYYKYVFDRAYSINTIDATTQRGTIDFLFDGEGQIWGFDLMLQKLESRYWDGWISYSFNYALYRNPEEERLGENGKEKGPWYFPSFHRFHNLNLVLNIKPLPNFNIGIRLGFASGASKSFAGKISYYPVLVVDENGNPVLDEEGNPQVIQKYKRDSYYGSKDKYEGEANRDGFALPLDLKFSFFKFNKSGKGRMEFYIAVENVLGFLETRRSNTTFNQYTGTEDQGSDTASYQIPLPIPSVGFTWTY